MSKELSSSGTNRFKFQSRISRISNLKGLDSISLKLSEQLISQSLQSSQSSQSSKSSQLPSISLSSSASLASSASASLASSASLTRNGKNYIDETEAKQTQKLILTESEYLIKLSLLTELDLTTPFRTFLYRHPKMTNFIQLLHNSNEVLLIILEFLHNSISPDFTAIVPDSTDSASIEDLETAEIETAMTIETKKQSAIAESSSKKLNRRDGVVSVVELLGSIVHDLNTDLLTLDLKVHPTRMLFRLMSALVAQVKDASPEIIKAIFKTLTRVISEMAGMILSETLVAEVFIILLPLFECEIHAIQIFAAQSFGVRSNSSNMIRLVEGCNG